MPRSAAALIAALHAELEQAQRQGERLLVATWQEADADAGYLLRTDGAMVGIGEYQYGFTHIDELSAPVDNDAARCARLETARILGGLDSVIGNPKHQDFLKETLPALFFDNAPAVSAALESGRLTLEGAADLLVDAKGRQVLPGSIVPQNRVTVGRDVSTVRLAPSAGGGFAWSETTAIRAGDCVPGKIVGAYAYLSVPGGMAQVPASDVTAEPLPGRHCKP